MTDEIDSAHERDATRRELQSLRIAGGRVVFGDELVRGAPRHGIWRGRVLAPVERDVLITYRELAYTEQELRGRARTFEYEVPGIAPLVYYGPTDRASLEDGRPRSRVCVQILPGGEPLRDAPRLDAREAVRLGLGLCDLVLAWRPPALILGLCPDTVYVTGELGERYLAGATPRSFAELGSYQSELVFPADVYEAPFDDFDRTAEDWLFTAALIVWFGVTGEHAFRVGAYRNEDHNVRIGRRAPFPGPPELGRLLEAVLVAEVARRMKPPELREELARLAARWGVDEPPFPPPGLA